MALGVVTGSVEPAHVVDGSTYVWVCLSGMEYDIRCVEWYLSDVALGNADVHRV